MKTADLKKITVWHEADKHEEIVKFLTDKGLEKLSSEEKHLLARAYNNVSEYGKAIELLLSIADEYEDDALWHFRMGYALFYRGENEHLDAAYYFAKAYELDPEDNVAKVMMIQANKLEPMTERVKNFWAWFEDNEKTLLEIASGKSQFDREDIVDFISEGTDLISKNVFFNIGGGNEFTFCVEGNPYLFYLYPYIVEQAPKELKERWHFSAQKEELNKASFDFEMYGLKLAIADIKVKPIYDEEEEEFEIGFYIPKAEDLEEDAKKHFFYTIMELVVGEGLSFNYISSIKPLAKEEREMIPLSELADYIRAELKAQEKDCYANPVELYSVYQREPNDAKEDYVPRQDIFLGNTCCMPVLTDYYNEWDYMYCGFNSLGADAAFLCFVLPDEVEGQMALSLRNDLEDSIETFLKKHNIGLLLGAAIANGVLYIDLLLYNFKTFFLQGFNSLEALYENIFPAEFSENETYQEILAETQIFYASFDRDAPITKLYPADDEDEDDEDDESPSPKYLYEEAEVECIEAHISEAFGETDNVFHEIISPDIHLDIMITEPSPERNYYTLTTCGMGAYQMNVPQEVKDDQLDRAELCICLPPDWDINSEDERYYWPIRLLKIVGRLPINNETWLGWGHSLGGREQGDETLAPNVGFTGAMLVNPSGIEEGKNICTLPNGERVNFYQIIPLYPEEVDYKCEHRAESLLERMQIVSHVIDPTRPNVCKAK